jgi:glyoxylase-like metal-dependent hydrolase (beta-lactamase superfamily II)
MQRLSNRIWYSEPRADTDRPLLAVIIGDDTSMMVDGGNSPNHAEYFLTELLNNSLSYPDLIVLTHAHHDHIFGLSSLKGKVVANSTSRQIIRRLQTYGWNDEEVSKRVSSGEEHEKVAQMLKLEMPDDRRNFKIREPDIVYETRLEINLGHLNCCIEKIGGGHAIDSTTIYIPDEKVVFIGDCLYITEKEAKTTRGLVTKLLEYDAELYIDSHNAHPIIRNELERKLKVNKSMT